MPSRPRAARGRPSDGASPVDLERVHVEPFVHLAGLDLDDHGEPSGISARTPDGQDAALPITIPRSTDGP